MANPYYEPKSIAPILQSGLQSRMQNISQPTGGLQAALPALGQMAESAFAQRKKMSIMEAQKAYADYLSKVDAGTATDEDHRTGVMAGLSLGLQPPKRETPMDRSIQQASLEKTQAETAKLKRPDPAVHGSDAAFYTNPVTGMMFRIKPGHKGSEYIPLPGQMIGPDGKTIFSTDKPIPAETIKAGSLAEAGQRAIAQIRGIIASPENKKRLLSPSAIAGGFGGDALALVLGDEQAQIMGQQIQEAGDAIARLRTGAAITASEEARYGNLLKGRFKTAAAYANALATVDRFLSDVQRDIKVGRRKIAFDAASPAPSASAPPVAASSSDDLLSKYGAP